MATTINSGYANSPKLTANIADHADVFGGRGLIFDGVTDYLSLADSISLSGQFTISMWVYLDDNTSINLLGDSSSSANFMWIDANSDIQLASSDLSITFTDSNMTTSSWQNILVTRDGSNVPKFYNNGALIQTLSADAGTFSFNQIGTYHTGSNFFNGKMSDVKIFNTALTESQVTELYRKPENTPSAVQDNLVAWYPMIEGNPESPQSIVYDHSEKGLGANLVLNNSFENDGASWGNIGSPTTSEINTDLAYVRTGTKSWKIVADGDDDGIFQNVTQTAGKIYYVEAYVYIISGAVELFSNGLSVATTSTTGSFQKLSGYYSFGSNITLTVRSFNTGGTFYIDDVSIQEVRMGNHATTNFFGDEIVNDPSFDTALANGQTNANFKLSGDGSITGGAFVFTAGSGVGRITIMDDASTETTFANTKTYQVQFTISSSGNALLNFDWVNGGYVNYGNGSHTLTAIGDGGNLQMQASPSGNDFSMTDISIKEVGISSSGFDTAVNEPVVPQVPLMRYNQKMLFDGIDDKVDLTTSIPRLGTSDFSISFWLCTLTALTDKRLFGSDNSSTTQWSVHGEGTTQLRWNGGLTATSSALPSSATFNDGKLRHIVISADRSGNLIYYVDGVLLSSHDISSDSAVNLKSIRYIGTYGAGTSAFAQINIFDDFSLWNYALSATQVQELFNDGVAYDATTHSKASALKAYWRNDGVTTWKNRGDKFASFDGVNDIITRNAINVDYKSVSVWVRPNTTITSASSGSELMFFGNWDFGSCRLGQATGDFTNELITLTDNHGGGTKKTGWIPSSGETIPNDSWTHIAFIWDGSKYVIYYNGQPQTVVTASNGHAPLNTNKNIRIGTGGANSSSFFGGDITGVAFWSESLTDAQVLSIYNAGQNGNIASIQSSDLELYYTFNPHASTDADTNSSVQDRSGNNRDSTSVSGAVIDRDGTVQGSPDSITIREGLNSNRDGLGFYFETDTNNVLRLNAFIDGEKLVIPHTKSLSIGADFTLEAWVKLKDLSDYRGIISKRSGTNVNYSFFVTITGSDDGKLGSFDGSSEVISNATINDNDWHHVAQVHSGTTTTFYIDGSASGGGTQSNFAENTHPVEIGSARTDSNDLWDGLIDEVKIYNRALSASEVLKNYKHQKGKHKND